MNTYCVVYLICETHYRYRCNADDKKQARRLCMQHMGVKSTDIVSIEKEN